MEWPKNMPVCHARRAREIIRQLQSGMPYNRVGGRKIRQQPSMISFRLGLRYRLLGHWINGVFTVRGVFTHERYNIEIRKGW